MCKGKDATGVGEDSAISTVQASNIDCRHSAQGLQTFRLNSRAFKMHYGAILLEI
jgi:hypothetical protein